MSRKLGFLVVSLIIVSITFTACKNSTKTPTSMPSTDTPSETTIITESPQDPFEFLSMGAKSEGLLVSYVPSDNKIMYNNLSTLFTNKYEIPHDDTNKSVVEIIKSLKDEVDAPIADVVDLPLVYAKSIKEGNLSQEYRHAYWEEIPGYAKDPEGRWSAAYWGSIAFTVNTDIINKVPQTWQDLLQPEYKETICMGDPRESNTANMVVLASAYANGGDVNNIQPGVDYFMKLRDAGQLLSIVPSESAIEKSECPISLFWDFDGLSIKESLGMNLEIVIPSDGTVAGLSIQFITSNAPHPNAARLMFELVYSDEGQLAYAQGFRHPIRENFALPSELQAKFPAKESYSSVVFPDDIDALANASVKISEAWSLINQ